MTVSKNKIKLGKGKHSIELSKNTFVVDDTKRSRDWSDADVLSTFFEVSFPFIDSFFSSENLPHYLRHPESSPFAFAERALVHKKESIMTQFWACFERAIFSLFHRCAGHVSMMDFF